MGTIAVRKNNGHRTAAHASTTEGRRSPFRMMRDLLRWDPFGTMTPLAPEASTSAFIPLFEIKETKDAYVFKADVPGVKESDIAITVTGNRLVCAGKREAEKRERTDTYYSYERSYGDFSRSFTLPEGADPNAVHAELKDGVLTLAVAKKPGAQTKKIAIHAGQKKA